MAWFGEGLSSLKGQLTNFTKEVLSEGGSVISGDPSQISSFQTKVEELEALCASQELEISRVKAENDSFRNRLEEFEVPLPEQGDRNGSTDSWWSVQHWNLPNTSNADRSANKGGATSADNADNVRGELLCLQQLLDEEKERRVLLEQQVEKLSSEVTEARTFKAKWQDAESKVKELDGELQKVQHQLLDQISDSQANTSELREEVEHTLQLLLHEPSDKAQFLCNRQDIVNLIIQMTKKSKDAELAVKKLQEDGKQLSDDVNIIIRKLGDPEEQEIIHGALNALELENQVLKLRNAQLEDAFKGHVAAENQGNAESFENMSDSFEMVLRNNEEHVQQLQLEWAEEKQSMERNMLALYEQLEKNKEKLGALEKEKSCGERELEAMSAVVQDLEAQLATSKDETATLTSSLELLDLQHQDAIDQLLVVKKSLQDDNERLVQQQQLEAAKQRRADTVTTDVQTEDDEVLESLIHDKVTKLLTFEIAEEFYSKKSGEEKGSQLVAALVKMSAECKWQRDTLERKVACLMKELRECHDERDLLAELSQGNNLAPIPENSEEAEILGQTVVTLEEKVAVLTESRSNLEADAGRLREESRRLMNLLQASEESLRNERNLNTEAIAKLNAHISDLQEQIESLQKSFKDADHDRSAVHSLLNDTKLKLENEMQVNAEVKLLLQETEIEKCALQEEFDKVSAKVAAICDVDVVRQDYADLQKKYDDNCFELQGRIRELESHKSDLQLEVRTSNKQYLDMSREVEESRRLCAELHAVILEKDNIMDSLKMSSEMNGVEVCKVKDKFEELITEHKYLEEKLSETQSFRAIELDELKELRDKVIEQKLSLDCLQETLTSKDEQYNHVTHVRAELENSLSELQQESSDWKNRAHAAKQRLDETLTMKATLEEECKHLAEKLGAVTAEEVLRTEELCAVKQQLRDSSDLELNLQRSQQRVSELEDQVCSLKAALLTADGHLEAEQERRSQLEAEYGQHHVTLDQMGAEAAKWRQLYNGAIAKLEVSKQVAERNTGDDDAGCKEVLRQEFACEHPRDVSLTKQSLGEVHNMAADSNITAEKYDVCKEMSAEEHPAVGADVNRVRNEVESFIKNLGIGEGAFHLLRKKLFEVLSAKNNMEMLLETKLQEIDLLKAKLLKLERYKTVSGQNQFQSAETSHVAKETIARLSEIRDKDLALEVLAQKNESLSVSLQNASTEVSSRNEEVSRLQREREELIKAVRQKHEESVHYHAEIQRLSALLNQELKRSEENQQQQRGLQLQFEDKQKMLLNTQNELISVKQRLEKLEVLAQNGESFQTVVTVQRNVAELEAQLANKEEIIKRNGEMFMSCENVIQAKEQELHHLRSQVVHLQAQIEKYSVKEQNALENSKVAELESKLTSVSDALQEERTKSKYLVHEAQELREKESALHKELERLRLHLVGVEDHYTQEALKLEAQVQDWKQQVLQAEERIKNSSTAYTSVSIRANQQVETLQEQVRLVSQQRDDIQQRLSSVEDQMERQAAALCNLQAVLKQFHRDKEREVMFETDRIRQQLQTSHAKEAELAAEIKSLKAQLVEAKEGLSAAARLGEQLDRKTDLVTTLKDEVGKLKHQLSEMEAHVETATQSSEGKVDRSLVKNLVLGYFVASAKNRTDVLRVVATVLDFSEVERSRVGLDSGAAKGTWAQHSPSLSEAFIKFLENESQPQLRLLPERKVSQSSEPGKADNQTPSRRTPLLLHDVQLPSFSQFPVSRNSSSILKDVLKDS